MRVTELKALTRDRGLRNYSQMRKAELVDLLQNNPPPGQSCTSTAPTPCTRPPHPNRPPPPPPTQTHIRLINYNLSMSENSIIQQGHMLVFRPDRYCEVRLSNNLIF